MAVLMDELHRNIEMAERADLLANAARLTGTVGDQAAARAVLHQADALANSTDAPHRRGIVAHCYGLIDRDPHRLLAAAGHSERAGRLLPRAQALEDVSIAFAEAGNSDQGREAFTAAHAIYAKLGADWDLARMRATLRQYGIRPRPPAATRRPRTGWDSLTPTELKIAALVADGLPNPKIAERLYLSRRTVQTHVSHILAKLGLASRTAVAREYFQR
jgi:DNA-binding CsgD family transcriptional regulator